VCPGIEEPNIVSAALAGLRERGWNAPRVQVTIRKHIPVAAGMGGGSADAAAVLRMATRLARVDDGVVGEIAVSLGADVPSQLEPGLVLGTGAGDEVELRAPLAPHAFVIVPLPHRLSTASVYAEADRLGLGDNELEFAARLPDLWSSLAPVGRLPERLLVNELEPAAMSLCPEIEPALAAVRAAGADHAFVSGSGPTVAGLLWGADGRTRAEAAAAALAPRYPGACGAVPVPRDFGFPLFV
jgi:4-diphosphocytidyl-2-C-methyl-D-erythritol kinase